MISQILFNQSSYKLTMVLLLAISVSFVTNAMNIEAINSTLLNEDSVYAVVEKMPQFPGGNAARVEFIKQHFQYPDEAQKNHEEGRVIVQFVVNSSGEIKNAKVVKSVSPSLNAEALRLINSFPAWIPGEMNGKKVSVYQVLPVSFKLETELNSNSNWVPNEKTLIVIDSLKMPLGFNIGVLNPEKIDTGFVLKPFPKEEQKKLIEQYGSLAENGVILLKSKNIRLTNPVYKISDSLKIEMPKFPGGDVELMKYLSHKVRYPVVSMENGVQGQVIVKFIVDSDGKIRNQEIKRSLDDYTDMEALRVVSAMPVWLPGKYEGKPINVEYTLPISFRLQGENGFSNGKEVWQKNDKTILLLDGQILPSGFNLQLMSFDQLKTFTKLKSDSKADKRKLIEEYGENAINGVILITSKNQIEFKNNNEFENNNISISEISPAHLAIASQYGMENALDGPIKSKAINVDNSNQINENNIIADKISIEGKVYDVIEQMPRFPGGDAALFKFIQTNLKYPVMAFEKHIQGRVIVGFVINAYGVVEQPQILRGVDPLLDQEAIRIINLMPVWQPGIQRGEYVSVRYTLPINFRLK